MFLIRAFWNVLGWSVPYLSSGMESLSRHLRLAFPTHMIRKFDSAEVKICTPCTSPLRVQYQVVPYVHAIMAKTQYTEWSTIFRSSWYILPVTKNDRGFVSYSRVPTRSSRGRTVRHCRSSKWLEGQIFVENKNVRVVETMIPTHEVKPVFGWICPKTRCSTSKDTGFCAVYALQSNFFVENIVWDVLMFLSAHQIRRLWKQWCSLNVCVCSIYP